MGFSNEDVFKCKKCDETVVYEPRKGQTTIENCFYCNAEHRVTVPLTIIELL